MGYKRLFISACVLCLGFLQVNAQSIRGKVIYVSHAQKVLLKFRSGIDNYSFVNKADEHLFQNKISNKNFSISSNASFKTANLVITEGQNTHLFILKYKPQLDEPSEALYDYSSKDKLNEAVQQMQVRNNIRPKENKPVTNQPVSTPAADTYAVNAANDNAASNKASTDLPVNNSNAEPKVQQVIKENKPVDSVRLTARETAAVPKVSNTVPPPVMPEKKVTPEKTVTEPEMKEIIKTDVARSKPETPKTLVSKNESPAKPIINSKKVQDSLNRQYDLALRFGKIALAKEDYHAAKIHYSQANEIKPDEQFPLAQLQAVEEKLNEIKNDEQYELILHFADSTAGIAKNYTAALRWYDSASKLKPQAIYPRKQTAAMKQFLLDEEVNVHRKQRTEWFNAAMDEYRKAERFRMERRYTEAYQSYSAFLTKLSTFRADEYLSNERHYINQATEFLSRLENYKPRPKVETPPPAPVQEENGKKKKRKKRTE